MDQPKASSYKRAAARALQLNMQITPYGGYTVAGSFARKQRDA